MHIIYRVEDKDFNNINQAERYEEIVINKKLEEVKYIMETTKKEFKQPKFLKKVGTLTLNKDCGVEPSDIIFFNGRKNVQLSAASGVDDKTYDIFVTT